MDCMLPCVWKIDPAFGLRSISETGMNEQLKRFQNLLVQARREKLTIFDKIVFIAVIWKNAFCLAPGTFVSALDFDKVSKVSDKMSDTSSLHRRIYAVLKTFLHGATEQQLTSDFKYFAGYDIPFENYGFTSLKDFMATAPNLYQIKYDVEGSLLYIAKSDGQYSLVENIVNRERCKDYDKRSQYWPSERAITETETNPIEEIEQPEEQQLQLSLILDNSTVATIKKMGQLDVFTVLREMKKEIFTYADLGHYIHPYEMQIRCYATFQTQFPASILHIETPSLFSLFPRSYDNKRCSMAQTLFESVAHMDPVFMNDIYCGKLYAVVCREMLCRCGLHACNASTSCYRGLCVGKLEGSKVLFRLIDFGCIVTVDISFVRQLPVEFESMMALSIDCKLDGLGVSTDDGKWTDGTINYVKNALRDKLFNAIVKQQYFAESDLGFLLPFMSVVLKSDDDSLEINSNLVAKGFASIL
ncbi:hypothetical protein T05_11579 [Trichinella murrelli]|uniref:HTH OST-type domain-containing protein n=1 Tax=Trichinella murrelli TaxID=144512 RepID=A0A0V0TBR3_9BILA|nr:hypothetical protein T05_11579 [Trichinella murrelli]